MSLLVRVVPLVVTATACAAVATRPAESARPPVLLTYVAQPLSERAAPSLCLARVDGAGRVRLARNTGRAWWSPNGRHAVYMDYARSRLVVADATGRVVRRLRPGGTFPRPDPVWSPDGRWVAQLAGGRGGLLEVIPARGGAAREVVGSLSLSTTYYSPTWAPDSRRLAFSMEADAVPAGVDRPSGIYTVAIDGSDLRLLVPRAQMPAYSPDGSKLAYVLDGDVVVSNADGTNARRVTQTAAPEDRPAWSPDGRLLAFSRVVRSRSVIVVARSNGTRARITVSSRRYHASLPSWRPASPLPQARRPACA